MTFPTCRSSASDGRRLALLGLLLLGCREPERGSRTASDPSPPAVTVAAAAPPAARADAGAAPSAPLPRPAASDGTWSVQELVERRGPPAGTRLSVKGYAVSVRPCWRPVRPRVGQCAPYSVALRDEPGPYTLPTAVEARAEFERTGRYPLLLTVGETPLDDAAGQPISFEEGARYVFRGVLVYTSRGATGLSYEAHERLP